MRAPWLALSRWRALPALSHGTARGWRVVAEDGREDYGPASPRVHAEHRHAQLRADELNADEQRQLVERLAAEDDPRGAGDGLGV